MSVIRLILDLISTSGTTDKYNKKGIVKKNAGSNLSKYINSINPITIIIKPVKRWVSKLGTFVPLTSIIFNS